MFKISKYIDIPIFIFCFAIGLLYVYITAEDSRIIHIYPTPENEELMLYKDKANQCFVFEHQEVPCPINPLSISQIPMQS